jgi:hypothetical protein
VSRDTRAKEYATPTQVLDMKDRDLAVAGLRTNLANDPSRSAGELRTGRREAVDEWSGAWAWIRAQSRKGRFPDDGALRGGPTRRGRGKPPAGAERKLAGVAVG